MKTNSVTEPAAERELHWPFAAKHENCHDCEKEYETPPHGTERELPPEGLLPPERIYLWMDYPSGFQPRWYRKAMDGSVEFVRADVSGDVKAQIVAKIKEKANSLYHTFQDRSINLLLELAAEIEAMPFTAPSGDVGDATGRTADWSVARLCEWPTAHFLAAVANAYPAISAALRARIGTVVEADQNQDQDSENKDSLR